MRKMHQKRKQILHRLLIEFRVVRDYQINLISIWFVHTMEILMITGKIGFTMKMIMGTLNGWG